MNIFGILGILDIVIFLGAVIAIFAGYKLGFIKKVLSLVGILAILGISFFYCTGLAGIFIEADIIYPNIYQPMVDKMLVKVGEYGLTAESTVVEFFEVGLGIPKFLANMIADSIDGIDVATSANQICELIAGHLTTMIMNIICFAIIAVALIIVIAILKAIANGLRELKIVRVFDGILGAVLYLALYIAGMFAIFALLDWFMTMEWFAAVKDFLVVDMQLDTESFRISKWIYEHNVLLNVFEFLF